MFFSEKLKKISKIQHCFFSRNNGVSKGIYESLNCGIGSNDLRENVQKNDIFLEGYCVLLSTKHGEIVMILSHKVSLYISPGSTFCIPLSKVFQVAAGLKSTQQD